MSSANAIAIDAAMSDAPLRCLCLLLTADILEMAVTGASAEAIEKHLEAVISAAERRIVTDAAVIVI